MGKQEDQRREMNLRKKLGANDSRGGGSQGETSVPLIKGERGTDDPGGKSVTGQKIWNKGRQTKKLN